MSDYYDLSREEQAKIDAKGIDYDLRACLEYNPQNFTIFDIEKVLAVWTGERDGDDWRWILQVTKKCGTLNGGRYVLLQGGCDYTGWDCQSWATSQFMKTPLKAARLALGELSGTYGDNLQMVYDNLVEQLKSSKKKTWHESKDEELGISGIDKIS